MRADGAEGPDLALRGPDDDARLAAELEDGGGVETELADAAGDGRLRRRLAAGRWNQKARDRIRDRRGCRHEPDRQERVEERAPIEISRGEGRNG
jgi:hypothetical protein